MITPKILIVDDDQEVLVGLSDYLRKRINCDIIMANSCERALEIFRVMDIHVLLQDLHFPTQLTGFHVIDYVLKEKPNIFILMISKWDDPEYMRKTEKEGRVYFVPKPLSFPEVKHRIETMLGKHGGFDYKRPALF